MDILEKDVIDLEKLKNLCSFGIPEDIKGKLNVFIFNGLRSLCWKLIIGYLPPSKAKWKERILK
jgi:hypothetical protein